MRRLRIENGHGVDSKTGRVPLPYKILHLLYKDDHYSSLRPPAGEDAGQIVAADKKDRRKAFHSKRDRCSSASPREPTRATSQKVPVKTNGAKTFWLAGKELRVQNEDIPSVVVNRPKRVVFQKGRPHEGSSSASSSRTSPRATSSLSSPRDQCSSKTEVSLGAAAPETPVMHVVYPNRLRFRNGVQQTTSAC